MNENELLNTVEKHHALLQRLLKAVRSKQNALINNDFDNLTTAISEEEKILSSINIVNRERANILKTLKSKYSPNSESFTITGILDTVSAEFDSVIKQKLADYLSEIKSLAEEIVIENYLNMTIIENSRNLLNDMVSVIAGKERTTILDRKY